MAPPALRYGCQCDPANSNPIPYVFNSEPIKSFNKESDIPESRVQQHRIARDSTAKVGSLELLPQRSTPLWVVPASRVGDTGYLVSLPYLRSQRSRHWMGRSFSSCATWDAVF